MSDKRLMFDQYEPLIASIGKDSVDAFYFGCAFDSLRHIEDLAGAGLSQDHLQAGLRAAFLTGRADVGRYLLDHGADHAPLVATIGAAAAEKIYLEGAHTPTQRDAVAPDFAGTTAQATERELNNLRLRWVSSKPRNPTVLAAVEGVESPRPTILHLQALDTSMPPAQRMARMRFDLDRTADAQIDRHASIVNVQGTPLHWAVDDHGSVWENREVVDFLLERGADPRRRDPWGRTPRRCVEEYLRLPDDCLSPRARGFYRYALGALVKAEVSVDAARRREGMGLWAKLGGIIGL